MKAKQKRGELKGVERLERVCLPATLSFVCFFLSFLSYSSLCECTPNPPAPSTIKKRQYTYAPPLLFFFGFLMILFYSVSRREKGEEKKTTTFFKARSNEVSDIRE
eukprot:Hpha_TRINITY_DN15337_c0_g1::TRINITY_DN15337_c0_g1_i1::g.88678::m.88678